MQSTNKTQVSRLFGQFSASKRKLDKLFIYMLRNQALVPVGELAGMQCRGAQLGNQSAMRPSESVAHNQDKFSGPNNDDDQAII